jgi:hypothetical protein
VFRRSLIRTAMLLAAATFVQISVAIAQDSAKVIEPSKGIVYVVLAVDTEPAGTSGPGRGLELDLSNFGSDSIRGEVRRLLSDRWRQKFTDTFGGHPKVTWYILTSEYICETGSCEAIYLEMQNYENDWQYWGDEIGWHYHHTDFVKCSQVGREYEQWNQLLTFNGTRYSAGTDVELCENVLNRLVAEVGFFPASFRAGWVWENDDFSRWLENVVPFDLSPAPPFKAPVTEQGRCCSNVSDWSRASMQWFPYRPDSTDYQRPGTMRRMMSRSLVQKFVPRDIDSLASNARAGRDQLVSIPLHSYSDMCNSYSNTLNALLGEFAERGIRFKFVTSAEAFRSVLRLKPAEPLVFRVTPGKRGVTINASGGMFQSFPYVVARGSGNSLKRIIPEKSGKRRWECVFDEASPEEIFVAGSTPDGKSTIQSFELERTGDRAKIIVKNSRGTRRK